MTRINSENIPDERRWFTVQRSININRYPKETQKQIRDLENKFGKICFDEIP